MSRAWESIGNSNLLFPMPAASSPGPTSVPSVKTADWGPPSRGEAGHRVGIELLGGVPMMRQYAVHPSYSWESTQPGSRGQILAGGGALVLQIADYPQHPPAHGTTNGNADL